jgi:hypothetical protein
MISRAQAAAIRQGLLMTKSGLLFCVAASGRVVNPRRAFAVALPVGLIGWPLTARRKVQGWVSDVSKDIIFQRESRPSDRG